MSRDFRFLVHLLVLCVLLALSVGSLFLIAWLLVLACSLVGVDLAFPFALVSSILLVTVVLVPWLAYETRIAVSDDDEREA